MSTARTGADLEIVVEKGGVEVHRFRVTGTMTLGRASTCDIVLDDVTVSRMHARLVVEARRVRLLDLSSTSGTFVDGRRVSDVYLERGQRAQLGAFMLRRVDVAQPAQPERNSALEETTGPDAGSACIVEVLDQAALDKALPHVRVGRHFVFIDDAQAVLAPSGRMSRLVGHKTRKGRLVKPLADAAVEIAGARIHPVPLAIDRIAGLACDRDVYRAEHDVVRLLIALPGGGTAKLRVRMNGAPLSERDVDVARGVAIETLAMLLPGAYEARLSVDGRDVGEPVRFTVAQYTLAPMSARLLEQRLDRSAGTLTVALGVESYGVAWDRPVRGFLVENGREMSDIAFTMDRAGRFTGKARVVGDGPFKVRIGAVDDPARVAEVALPGTRRRERMLTLAGELGKELHVSLLPEPGSLEVRGLHVTSGDFIGTPIVVEDAIAHASNDKVTLRAQDDVESLVVAAYDPARGKWSVIELGDVESGKSIDVEVARPMSIAFVACFVGGEPFEAFTTLFAAERAVSLEVPDVIAPGRELAVTFRTGRKSPIPVLVCIRDERLTATDAPLTSLASSTKRAIAAAGAGLGDDFTYTKLAELLPSPKPTVSPPSSSPPPAWSALPSTTPTSSGVGALRLTIRERNGASRVEDFEGASEITIGRVEGNDVVLPMRNISKRHARLVVRDGKLILVDLKSTNGTYLNGRRLQSPVVVKDSDKIYLGDFTIEPECAVADPSAARTMMLALAEPAAALRHDAGDDDDDDLFAEDSAALVAESAPPRAVAEAEPDLGEGAELDAALDAFDEASEMQPAIPRAVPAAPAARASQASDVDARPATKAMRPTREANGAAGGDVESTARKGAPGPRSPTNGPGGAWDAHDPAPIRATFPEVLFCGFVDVADGDQLRVPAGDSLGAFAIEVFWCDGADFGASRARVNVDKPVRIDVDVAPEIDPDDRVIGTVRIAARGSARVSVLRDGRAVALRHLDGRPLGGTDAVPSGTELVFDAGPGTYLAQVEEVGVVHASAVDVDVAGSESRSGSDALELRVGAPGVYRTLVREVALVDKGKRIALTDDMIALRVLPGIDEPFQMLAHATSSYEHMCCEQTAAKILSAVVMLLTTDDVALRRRAEEVVVAGIARERMMWRKGRGFSMYPEQSPISEHYTPRVVRYLWTLEDLADLRGLSAQLVEAVKEGLAMADDVAAAFAMHAIPGRVESVEDAWMLAVREPRRQRESLEQVAKLVTVDESGARAKNGNVDRVGERAMLAYAAAVLFACGKVQTGLRIANDVLRQLNEHGRMYSTIDSVATIALMVQLRKTGVCSGGAQLLVNGVATSSARAAEETNDSIETIEVVDGVAVVEITRVREERWADAKAPFPVRIGFRDNMGRQLTKFRRGDKGELVVSLPKGYVEGDLVHVCLPPAMSWIEGGGRVKRFTVDFAGRDEIRVPVVVTGALQSRQKFAVAVRNMFQEERAASPGLLVIEPA